MKKILFSILSLGVVAVVAIGATRAYFSDTEEILGNTIETGILEITGTGTTTVPTVISNWQPGENQSKRVYFQNTGTLPIGKFTVNMENVDDPLGLLSQVQVRVTCDDVNFAVPRPPVYPTSLWINLVEGLDNADLLTGSHGTVDTIPVGENHNCKITYRMISTADSNDYQGTSASFDLVFFAEQVR
jgi:predicted ribosomally synthesized peptide with SipW-like signal peptide